MSAQDVERECSRALREVKPDTLWYRRRDGTRPCIVEGVYEATLHDVRWLESMRNGINVTYVRVIRERAGQRQMRSSIRGDRFLRDFVPAHPNATTQYSKRSHGESR